MQSASPVSGLNHSATCGAAGSEVKLGVRQDRCSTGSSRVNFLCALPKRALFFF